MQPVLLLSITSKLLTLLIIAHATITLTRERNASSGIYTRYYLLAKRYDLLRASLALSALLLLTELAFLLIGTPVDPAQDLLSDLCFIGIALLLARMHTYRHNVTTS